MKRCPECEFIYEEEQTYCDMDGTKLIHDSQLLQSLSAEPTAVAKPSAWRNRLLIAVPMVAVIAMAFLALRTAMPSRMSATPVEVNASQSNTGSTEQNAAASSDESSNQPAREGVSETANPSEADTSGSSGDIDEAKQRSRTATTPTVASSARQPETTSQPVRSDKPATASSRTQPPPAKPTPTPAPKKESRIGSIFSKTKRILKKPFKL